MEDDGASRRAEGVLAGVLAGGIALAAAHDLSAISPFTSDDAYITLRYARHLVAGAGPVWNVGEPPVEGYSSFLFVLVGAAAVAAGLDPIVVFKGVSVVALAGACGALYAMARRWTGPIAATIPAYFFTRYPGTIGWTVSGLESAVYVSLGVGAIACLFRGMAEERAAPWLIAAGGIAGLASVTRPEGPLLAIFAVAALLLRERRNPRAAAAAILRFVAPFLLVFGPYLAWRFAFYGDLLPNAAYCKMRRSLVWSATLAFWDYAWPFLLVSLGRLPIQATARDLVLWGIPAAYAFLLLWVEPVIAWNNRYALLPIALLHVAAVAGMTTLAAMLFRHGSRPLREALLVVVCVVVTSPWSVPVDDVRASIAGYGARMANRERIARWLDERIPPHESIAVGDTGMIGWIVRAKVIDLYCLNSREFLRAEESRRRFADWVYERRPAAIVLVSKDPSQLEPVWMEAPVARHPALAADYELARVFATGHDPNYAYFAYLRR